MDSSDLRRSIKRGCPSPYVESNKRIRTWIEEIPIPPNFDPDVQSVNEDRLLARRVRRRNSCPSRIFMAKRQQTGTSKKSRKTNTSTNLLSTTANSSEVDETKDDEGEDDKGSSAKISNAKYRVQCLTSWGIYIYPSFGLEIEDHDKMPKCIKEFLTQNIFTDQQDSNPLTDQEVLAIHERLRQSFNNSEDNVIRVLDSGLLKREHSTNKTIRDQSSKTGAPWSPRPLPKKRITSSTEKRLSCPKPDHFFGYNGEDAEDGPFTEDEHRVMNNDLRPWSAPSKHAVFFPFIIFEMKSESSGSLWEAENQAAGGGTYCVRCMEYLYQQSQPDEDITELIQPREDGHIQGKTQAEAQSSAVGKSGNETEGIAQIGHPHQNQSQSPNGVDFGTVGQDENVAHSTTHDTSPKKIQTDLHNTTRTVGDAEAVERTQQETSQEPQAHREEVRRQQFQPEASNIGLAKDITALNGPTVAHQGTRTKPNQINPIDTLCFSYTMNSTIVSIWLHFSHSPERYRMVRLMVYVLESKQMIKEFNRVFRNICDWAAGSRLDSIQTRLAMLAEKARV